MKQFIHIYVQGKGYHIPPKLTLGRELTDDETVNRILESGYYGCAECTTWWQRMKLRWMLFKPCPNKESDLAWLQSARGQWLDLMAKASPWYI